MSYPTIRIEVKQAKAVRFLWLKYVTGFNPQHHCAKCLTGRFSKLFSYQPSYVSPQVVEGQLDEHESPWLYVCGVTRRWEWNLHIAGQFRPGESVEFEDERFSVLIRDFRQFPIDSSVTPPAEKEFATCRNWQFGWMAFPESSDRKLFQ